MIGLPRHHHRLCDSTNTRARELAEAGAPHGTVVTADEQTAGRGRHGRTWTAPAGRAVLMSVVVRPLGESRRLLPLAVPLAVCAAVEELTQCRCQVKWPNDVWLEGRKLSGTLIEARPGGPDSWAVVGIGLNVSIAPADFPPELRETATSVGGGAATADALAALLGRLACWVDAPPERVLEEFRARDALRGRRISWDGGEGTADGVDGAGNLLVLTESGARETLTAGEVHISVG